MTPDLLVASACQGKQAFDSRGLCEFVASRTASRKHCKVRVYRCGCCGNWHFGTTNMKKLRSKK